MSEAVFFQGLTKKYGEKTVVNHLNIVVKSGTVFGLLGANGAANVLLPICVMLGVSVLCTVLAVRFFKWE